MSKERVFSNLKESIAIENYKEIRKRQNKIKRVIQSTLTVTLCGLSVTGIVFAKDISTKIYNNFFLTGNGMATAMSEGYIENTDMEYQNSEATLENSKTGQIIEDASTQIKVSEFVMDDLNLSMTFDVVLSDKAKEIITAEETWKINFPDLLISDENNNILYCQDRETFENYCKENNLDYHFTEFGENYCNTGVNIVPIEKEGNRVKVVYNIYTGSETSFPKSKKLKVQMKQIKMSKEEETVMGGEEITLTGDWKIDVDVPEKMYNRETILYTQKSTTNENYKVTSAALYDTGIELTMKIKTEALPEHPTSEEWEFFKTICDEDPYGMPEIMNYISWKDMQTDEYKAYSEKCRYLYNITAYILDENGQKYEMTMGPRENGSKSIDEDGIMTYTAMFDMTKYNQSDKVIVHFDYNGESCEVVLEKKEEK